MFGELAQQASGLPQTETSISTEHEIATELVQRINSGDRAAEGELVKRYSRGLLLLLKSRTHDIELARDLRQDTFCVAIAKLRNEQLENPEQLSAYLSGIARNLAIGDIRKKARRKTSSDTDFLQHCADETEGLFEQVSRAQAKHAVRQLLRELTVDRDRELLTRYYVYDEDKDVICRQLALDSLHFNRVLHRAKARFRQLLEKAESHDFRLVK